MGEGWGMRRPGMEQHIFWEDCWVVGGDKHGESNVFFSLVLPVTFKYKE